jgi:hypothetical protein
MKELWARLGPLTGRSLQYATDSCLKRYLNAQSLNIQKAEKMIRESLEWRATYKPEEICWVSLFVSVAGHLHISISYGYMLPPFFASTHSYTVHQHVMKNMLLFFVQKDVATETETGKVYRANFHDKQGHPVVVMHPGRQVNEWLFFSPWSQGSIVSMDSQKRMMSVKDSLCFIIHSISCNLTQGLYPHVSVAAPDAEHQQQ